MVYKHKTRDSHIKCIILVDSGLSCTLAILWRDTNSLEMLCASGGIIDEKKVGLILLEYKVTNFQYIYAFSKY